MTTQITTLTNVLIARDVVTTRRTGTGPRWTSVPGVGSPFAIHELRQRRRR